MARSGLSQLQSRYTNYALQLSKDDEASVGEGELEVRREDQDKINKFSRLHHREQAMEEELKVKAVG